MILRVPFLFTEFADNGSIYDYIHKEHKQPPLSQGLLWAVQVAEGMLKTICQNDVNLTITILAKN